MRCAPVFPTIQYIRSTYYVDFGTGKKAIYRNLRKLNNFKPCSKTQITPLTSYTLCGTNEVCGNYSINLYYTNINIKCSKAE